MIQVERRKHERIPLNLKVEITFEDQRTVMLHSRDFSANGAFLTKSHISMPLAPIGNQATMILRNETDEDIDDEKVQVEIVRATIEGIGVKFLAAQKQQAVAA